MPTSQLCSTHRELILDFSVLMSSINRLITKTDTSEPDSFGDIALRQYLNIKYEYTQYTHNIPTNITFLESLTERAKTLKEYLEITGLTGNLL